MNRTREYRKHARWCHRWAVIAAVVAPLMCAIWTSRPANAQPGAQPDGAREAFIAEYRQWLDQARTPAAAVAWVGARSPGWTHIDYLEAEPAPIEPGARLWFTDRGRSAVFVLVGRDSLTRAGVRMVAAHIDTPSPRLDLGDLAVNPERPALTARAHRYGGVRTHHYLHTPLALVGRVAPAGEPRREIDIALGLAEDDDFAFYATEAASGRAMLDVILASIPPRRGGREQGAADAGAARRDADWLFAELERRYSVTRADLAAAELFLVPQGRAREVGVDRSLIGAHGQDDRANSYLAWRAINALEGVPERTVVVWLVDREEVGSYHVAGATSRFLEAVVAYLVRCQGGRASEAVLGRIFQRSQAISADTPAALNPNFPEVHEEKNAPVVGRGAALFAYTGSGGKDGGTGAHAALIRDVMESFARAGQPLQYGTLGRVDEGGGGTIAKYLANRGIDVVDVGVAGISLHSPMELFAKDDLWSAYHGFRTWLGGQ